MSKRKKSIVKNKKFMIGITILLVLAVITVGLYASPLMMKKKTYTKTVTENLLSAQLSPADLESEVYPEFLCTCCDNPLEECSCGLAKGMRKWLEDQVNQGITKEDLLIKASKEFGMKAVEHEETKELIKQVLLEQAGSNPPAIEIFEPVQNLGTIRQSEEIVSTTFEIKNTGKSDLIIDSMDTSCMCTTATITFNGEEGPEFGMSMHGTNPKNWQLSIPPGAIATLNVYYDPMAHGVQKKDSMRITRTVTISSNDPVNFQKEVRIDFEQVK